MAKKKLKKISESGFIPGIYNYCDRWCEKCELQSQCVSFVIGKKLEEKGELSLEKKAPDGEDALWKQLKHIFESVCQVLQELADEKGLDVKDIYPVENICKDLGMKNLGYNLRNDAEALYLEEYEMIQICMIYEHLFESYLDHSDDFWNKENVKELLTDAFENVEWYVDFIQNKLLRALFEYSALPKKEGKEEEHNYNGYAKIALIAIERSVKGWQTIYPVDIKHQRDISQLLVVLEQLTLEIERLFPQAYEFQRPGFDKPGISQN